MWTSNTMTFWESIMTFLIGFSIVFIALIALALFIIVSSKVINLLVKEEVADVHIAIPLFYNFRCYL